MKYEMDGYQIKWICNCGIENEDWFNWTVFPECADCMKGYDWDDIVDLEDLGVLNRELTDKA